MSELSKAGVCFLQTSQRLRAGKCCGARPAGIVAGSVGGEQQGGVEAGGQGEGPEMALALLGQLLLEDVQDDAAGEEGEPGARLRTKMSSC